MRCPSCGTENEPDSRFCGGCGGRLAGESRLAPTQKIDTGAQPVQQPAHAVVHRTPSPEVRIPDSRPPDSRPPRGISGSQNVPPASFPLTPSVQRPPRTDSKPQPIQHTPSRGSQFGPSNGASPPGTSQQPIAPARSRPDASASFQAPKRRTGLIFALLLVDLALAGAGAYLLVEGLSTSAAAPAPAAPGSAAPAKSGSSAAVDVRAEQPAALANTSPPDAAPPDAAIVVTPIPDDAAPAVAVTPPIDAPVKKTTQSRKKVKDRKKTTQPVDPYDEGGPGDPFPPDLPPPPPPPPEP